MNKYKKVNNCEDVLTNEMYDTSKHNFSPSDIMKILREKRRESDPKKVKYLSPNQNIQKKLDFFYIPYSRNQM
mgnify:CR=1 FL=1